MALTPTESEMVLMARLPDDDRVMAVQTPRLRTIADLEDFIVDEYSRVFPHLPKLSRDLRIQKCVSTDLVVDRRAQAQTKKQTSHCFVDLAKNVQAGNVFKDMEQIYIVVNSGNKKHKQPQQDQHKTKKIAAEAHNTKKNGESHKKNAAKTPQQDKSAKTAHDSKTKAAAKESHADKKKTVAKDKTDGKKKKDNHDGKAKAATKEKSDNNTKEAVKEKNDAKTKVATKEKDVAKNKSATKEKNDAQAKPAAKENDGTKKADGEMKQPAAKENHDSKTKAGTKDNQEAKKKTATQKDNNASKKTVVNDAPKKVSGQPKKSENVLLQKMLAAKQNANESGAALIAKTLPAAENEKATKTEQKRKASGQEAAKTGGDATSDAQQPPLKKSKANTPASGPAATVDNNDKVKTIKSSKKKTTPKSTPENSESTPSTESEAPPKKKSVATEEVPIAKTARKSKKKLDAEAEKAEKPATKRAKTESTPKVKTSSTKTAKPTLKVEAVTPVKDADSETVSNSSSSSSSSASASPPKEAPKSKSGRFQEILKATQKRMDAERAAEAERLASIADKQEKNNAKQTLKSPEETASESSDSDTEDQDARAVKSVVVAAPQKKQPTQPKKTATVESSSSSDEEELDYSQSLLADLTKNDTDEEKLQPTQPSKKKKIVKAESDNDSVETSQTSDDSQDMPSSELTQKPQETNSVLTSSLSRNRFSLGSMPVAKLKKSSKNPFSSASPKKVKTKSAIRNRKNKD